MVVGPPALQPTSKCEQKGLLGTEANKLNCTMFLIGRDGLVVERCSTQQAQSIFSARRRGASVTPLTGSAAARTTLTASTALYLGCGRCPGIRRHRHRACPRSRTRDPARQLGLSIRYRRAGEAGRHLPELGLHPHQGGLLKSGQLYEQSTPEGERYGLSVEEASLDFGTVVAALAQARRQPAIISGIAFLMKKHKIEVVEGVGQAREGRPSPKVVVALKAGGGRYGPGQERDPGQRRRGPCRSPLSAWSRTVSEIWTYRDALAPKAMPTSLVVSARAPSASSSPASSAPWATR